MLNISALSLEYVRARVVAKEGSTEVDPTSYTVKMAFTTTTPVTNDWKTATWETDADPEPDVYYARCLVGPAGTVTLTAGTYLVWVKITNATPEVPVKFAGTLNVS
jgi:hypothetical protein